MKVWFEAEKLFYIRVFSNALGKTSLFYPSGRDLWLLCNKGHAGFNQYWEQNTYGDTVESKET